MGSYNLEPEFQSLISRIPELDEAIHGKRVLVTGATGAIGSYIFRFLNYGMALGWDFQLVGSCRDVPQALKAFPNLESNVSLSAYQISEGARFLGHYDWIIHALGAADPKSLETDPGAALFTQLLSLEHALSATNESGRFALISTREVYGREPGSPLCDESVLGQLDPADLRSAYPISKIASESLANCYAQKKSISVSNLRLGHSYGPGMKIVGDGRIMNDLVEMAISGNGIRLKSDGSAVRAFCYIEDTVAGILTALIRNKDAGTYNLANEEEPISILEVAELAASLFPRLVPTITTSPTVATSAGYFNPKPYTLATDKLRNLGWRPEISLREGLRRTIDYYLSH